MRFAFRWLNKAAEGVAAAMLAAMFLTFVLQVFSRYVLVNPIGWTLELCLTLWVWIVFWGNAFVVRDKDHVAFDILYLSVPPGPRRVLALISVFSIYAVFLIAVIVAYSVRFVTIFRHGAPEDRDERGATEQ